MEDPNIARSGAGPVPPLEEQDISGDEPTGVAGKTPPRYYNVSLVGEDGATVDKRTVDGYELEQTLVELAGGEYAVFSVEAGVGQDGEPVS